MAGGEELVSSFRTHPDFLSAAGDDLQLPEGNRLVQLAALYSAQGRSTSFSEYFWENRQQQLEADLEGKSGMLSTPLREQDGADQSNDSASSLVQMVRLENTTG